MRPRTACLLALLLAAPAFAAAGPEDARVRCLDTESLHLLQKVRGQSPTARRMIDRLEKSDLITFVRIGPSFARLRATTRILGHVREARFVLISITSMAPEVDKVLLLGHELQHAVELADAPWVRNDNGMIEMYERIGWRDSARAFETAAAVEAGRAVKEEVILAARLARNGSAVPGVSAR
jgi:hypothetical protein